MNQDIRWKQRLQNYSFAFQQLSSAVQLAQKKQLSDLEKQGLIQAFEFTHELAWNVLKDYLQYQSAIQVNGSRDAIKEAFKLGLISNAEAWLEMIQSRNMTTHAYNKRVADDICGKITAEYFSLFSALQKKMSELAINE